MALKEVCRVHMLSHARYVFSKVMTFKWISGIRLSTSNKSYFGYFEFVFD